MTNGSQKPKNDHQDYLFDMNKSTPPPPVNDSFQRFSRYSLDFLGILLLTIGLVTFLALTGITKGVFITPLVDFLTRWLGLGRFFLALAVILIGWQVIKWKKHPPEKIALGKILAFEASAFFLMAFLSVLEQYWLPETEVAGKLGGIIGWAIAEFFGMLLGKIGRLLPILLGLVISILAATGLFKRIERQVLGDVDQNEAGQNPDGVHGNSQNETDTLADAEPVKTAQPAKVEPATTLPPQFRKSFEPISAVDEKPASTLERSKALPSLDLLDVDKPYRADQRNINLTAGLIEKTLADFGIPAKVVGFRSGPTVTQFAVEPGYIEKNGIDDKHKIRVAQIMGLQKDLTLALSAERLRIEAPVPGKSYVGIEVPNEKSSAVRLRGILESDAFMRVNSPLAIALGRDVSGRAVVSDLATMPHLLIAGTTGSGKSVCISAITACLVMNNTPEQLRLAMIDPKRVELNRFNGLPHILGSVEVDIERIIGVLRWATAEMDFRYKLLENVHARNLDSYNLKMKKSGKPTLPRIVVIVDELADLMMNAPDQTEQALVRLAQKARAIGIHLVVATQRPSTDVVTGLIKANFPTRLSFTVASSIDSRVILDTSGAETLLGKGDMLFMHPESGLPLRSQGVMVTDRELNRVIDWWANQAEVQANNEEAPWEEALAGSGDESSDRLVDEAIALIKRDKRASASYFQRQLRIGYPRAARLVDQLEEMGILGESLGGGKDREILLDFDLDNE